MATVVLCHNSLIYFCFICVSMSIYYIIYISQAIEWIRDVGEVYLSTHHHNSGDQDEAEKLLEEHRL